MRTRAEKEKEVEKKISRAFAVRLIVKFPLQKNVREKEKALSPWEHGIQGGDRILLAGNVNGSASLVVEHVQSRARGHQLAEDRSLSCPGGRVKRGVAISILAIEHLRSGRLNQCEGNGLVPICNGVVKRA